MVFELKLMLQRLTFMRYLTVRNETISKQQKQVKNINIFQFSTELFLLTTRQYLIYSVFRGCQLDGLDLDFYKCMKISVFLFFSRNSSVKSWNPPIPQPVTPWVNHLCPEGFSRCVVPVSIVSLGYIKSFVYMPVFWAGIWAFWGSSFVILIFISSASTVVSGTSRFSVNICTMNKWVN